MIIALVIVSVLLVLSFSALIAYKSGYDELMERFKMLSKRCEENALKVMSQEKTIEELENKNYRIVRCREERVDMRPVSCRVTIPNEIEEKHKRDYVAAIAKDMLWDYAKDVAYYRIAEDYMNRSTVVELSWFINAKGEKLDRDSFL